MVDDPDANIVYMTDTGLVVYRASGVAGCIEALAYARMGMDPVGPGEKMQKVYDRGHGAELPILERLKADGIVVIGGQERVELQITGNIVTRGHLDGLGLAPSREPVIVEAKSQNQDQWDDFAKNGWDSGFFPKYKWQTSIYMLALNMQLILARGLVDEEGKVIDVRWQIIEKPWYTIEDIRARILQVEQLAHTGDFQCEGKMFPCPYFPFHVAEIDDDPDGTLRTLSVEYLKVSEQAKLVEARKKELQKALIAKVADGKAKGSKTLEDGTKLSVWEQAGGPDSYDWEKMAEDGIDITPYKKPKRKTPRVKVTLKGEGVGNDDDK